MTDGEQDLVDELIQPFIPDTTKDHPFVANLPDPPPPSAFWSTEHDRLSKGLPLNAIDTSRYQVSDDIKSNIVSKEYLSNRTDNLALLETYGANSWLIGNAIQEHSLGLLEAELSRLKDEGTKVNRKRKHQNLESGAQIDKLIQRWKKALRGVVEVEIACALLEEEIRRLHQQTGNS